MFGHVDAALNLCRVPGKMNVGKQGPRIRIDRFGICKERRLEREARGRGGSARKKRAPGNWRKLNRHDGLIISPPVEDKSESIYEPENLEMEGKPSLLAIICVQRGWNFGEKELLTVRSFVSAFAATASFLARRRNRPLRRLWNFLRLFPYARSLALRLLSRDFSASWRQNSFRRNLRCGTLRLDLLGSLGDFPRLLLAWIDSRLIASRWRDWPFGCWLSRPFRANLFGPLWNRSSLGLRSNARLVSTGRRQWSFRCSLTRTLRLILLS